MLGSGRQVNIWEDFDELLESYFTTWKSIVSSLGLFSFYQRKVQISEFGRSWPLSISIINIFSSYYTLDRALLVVIWIKISFWSCQNFRHELTITAPVAIETVCSTDGLSLIYFWSTFWHLQVMILGWNNSVLKFNLINQFGCIKITSLFWGISVLEDNPVSLFGRKIEKYKSLWEVVMTPHSFSFLTQRFKYKYSSSHIPAKTNERTHVKP
jgi:hypothetical protein